MARRRSPRKHTVKGNLQFFELAKAGSSLEFTIYAHRRRLGELTIGRGSVYWRGAYRKNAVRISWTRFARMMDELAYGE